jgi:RNA polymerase sigma-70 factor (ECF subfamily)
MISLLLIGLLLAALEAGSDSELVAMLRSGDQPAFKSIFDRYHAQLLQYLIRRGVPTSAAEDILQDAFLAVWERRKTLDPSRSVKGYLYRSCHNRAVNHFRDHSKFVADHDAPETALMPSQEADLSYHELKSVVDLSISELPDRRRAVFELCFISGLTYREAADTLGISVKTVENQMGHALRTIRERVQHLL